MFASLGAADNEVAEWENDGRLILRYLFEFRGDSLVNDIVCEGSGLCDYQPIEIFLDTAHVAGILDADGDLTNDALSDGILIFRYLVGKRKSDLVLGAVCGAVPNAMAMP